MAAQAELAIGDIAPAFALRDSDGATRHLDDFNGHRLVLFFYPRADTPGCTTQAQDFSALLAQFEAIGVIPIGISADPPRKLAQFRSKRDLSVILLSDESREVLNGYGVWGKKSMYGKTFEGILRSTFAIGRNRRITHIWRGVKVPGHARAVLQDVQSAG